jgi:hypothetical protein
VPLTDTRLVRNGVRELLRQVLQEEEASCCGVAAMSGGEGRRPTRLLRWLREAA